MASLSLIRKKSEQMKNTYLTICEDILLANISIFMNSIYPKNYKFNFEKIEISFSSSAYKHIRYSERKKFRVKNLPVDKGMN